MVGQGGHHDVGFGVGVDGGDGDLAPARDVENERDDGEVRALLPRFADGEVQDVEVDRRRFGVRPTHTG